MIINSNTIINPWAMMIKSINTSIANITVSTSICSNYFTIWAKVMMLNLFN